MTVSARKPVPLARLGVESTKVHLLSLSPNAAELKITVASGFGNMFSFFSLPTIASLSIFRIGHRDITSLL